MNSQDHANRRGYTILEIVISLGILTVAMLAVGETVGLVAQQRRATERRQLATQLAENAMERLFARPWNELTPEQLAKVEFPAEVQREFPGATLKLEVEEVAGPPAAKRLRVEVGWNDATGPIARPVRLTAWRYQE